MKEAVNTFSHESSKRLNRTLYRCLRRYGENGDFLRNIIAAKDLRFYAYARRALFLHESRQIRRSACSSHLSIVDRVMVGYYSMVLASLRMYCKLQFRRVGVSGVVLFCTLACIMQIYAELWHAIQRGKANESAKRRQIISVIEQSRT